MDIDDAPSTSNPDYQLSPSSSSACNAPVRSSPVAIASSPLSYPSSPGKSQHIRSSPSAQSILPLSDLPDSEPDMAACKYDMMINLDDDDQHESLDHSIGVFNSAASSSPGPSWLPALAPNRHENVHLSSNTSNDHRRLRGWKQPPPRSSPRSSGSGGSGGTPMSSPTPLSRAYGSRAHLSARSPSELRQQAASKFRALERQNRSNAHRPLLDAFSIGSRKGIDDTLTSYEERMTEAIDRRHIRQMNRQWEAMLSSQAYATDDLIEEAQETHLEDMVDESTLDFDMDSDGSDMHAKYGFPDGMDEEQDTSMTSTASTVRPDHHQPTLLSILISPTLLCPACSREQLKCIESSPTGVECPHCNWSLPGDILKSIDDHFHHHGERASHRPLIAYDPNIGTNFVCSNPECDEMVCV